MGDGCARKLPANHHPPSPPLPPWPMRPKYESAGPDRLPAQLSCGGGGGGGWCGLHCEQKWKGGPNFVHPLPYHTLRPFTNFSLFSFQMFSNTFDDQYRTEPDFHPSLFVLLLNTDKYPCWKVEIVVNSKRRPATVTRIV